MVYHGILWYFIVYQYILVYYGMIHYAAHCLRSLKSKLDDSKRSPVAQQQLGEARV